MFLDESGFLMAPLVRRTWGPLACTPVLSQRTRHHRKVSATAVLCIAPDRQTVRLYFRLRCETSIDAPATIAFLRDLGRELRAPIMLVWDNLGMHRSKALKTFWNSSPQLHVRFLPPYGPELNPVENVWGYLKCNPLANFAPAQPEELLRRTRSSGQSIQKRQSLLQSFVKHCQLPLRLK